MNGRFSKIDIMKLFEERVRQSRTLFAKFSARFLIHKPEPVLLYGVNSVAQFLNELIYTSSCPIGPGRFSRVFRAVNNLADLQSPSKRKHKNKDKKKLRIMGQYVLAWTEISELTATSTASPAGSILMRNNSQSSEPVCSLPPDSLSRPSIFNPNSTLSLHCHRAHQMKTVERPLLNLVHGLNVLIFNWEEYFMGTTFLTFSPYFWVSIYEIGGWETPRMRPTGESLPPLLSKSRLA
ncbi:hypothetical protein CROQUDRAFT_92010 [Cronartium quercuum f. sp. fusiforme G11]|uniref:Uncharacterized protein n=1 Tax=Cronartium quercuum f. sp. fusiforme G11 TaxID=708437 RepID=A0A9P6TCU6_9BASI|nr:hypothetical protein CROQUDRAFT_92010 [Cronartium quercuum f. sp. fusiforme G11]